MTLCIAWQDSEGVHFASDSRVSAGGSYADSGVKVYAVPVTVFPPKMAGEPDPVPRYRQTIGMCTAGSLLTVYNVAEILRDLLSALHTTPWNSELPMDALSSFAAELFEDASRRVCDSLGGPAGMAELVLGGMCREQKRIRTFRVSLDATNYPISARLAELDLSKGPECIGSGATSAMRHFSFSPGLSPLKVLKAVVLDETIHDVGGCIQYGEFHRGDFTTLAVRDYIFDASGRKARVGFFIRGMNVSDVVLNSWRVATPRIKVILPFENEINELFDKDLVVVD